MNMVETAAERTVEDEGADGDRDGCYAVESVGREPKRRFPGEPS